MNTLKPCPFCGGKNVLSTELQDGLPFIAYCQCGAENEAENWNARPIEDALNARIAELEAERRWIPVSERLPEDGEVVWLWDGNNLGMGYYLIFSGCFMDRDTPLRRIKPTHWMSLPTPPEVEE